MPHIALNREGLAQFRKRSFIDADQTFAGMIGMSASAVSRVLSGEQHPSNPFIGGTLKLFGRAWFNELFEVID